MHMTARLRPDAMLVERGELEANTTAADLKMDPALELYAQVAPSNMSREHDVSVALAAAFLVPRLGLLCCRIGDMKKVWSA